MKIYTASSWKNPVYDRIVKLLEKDGHEVYNFRKANHVFNWAQIDSSWDPSNPVLSSMDLMWALSSDIAGEAFKNDKEGLDWCDIAVMIMPCGRSAHLEAGYLIGKGKEVHILLADNEKPDLMHLLVGIQNIHSSIDSLLASVRAHAFVEQVKLPYYNSDVVFLLAPTIKIKIPFKHVPSCNHDEGICNGERTIL